MGKQLLIACDSGKVSDVQKLLADSSIDPNHKGLGGRTGLYYACAKGHTSVVKLLLEDKRLSVNSSKNDGKGPFYIACENGHLDIVKLLLDDNRVEVNKPVNTGATPLIVACCFGRTEIVELILASGRIVNLKARGNSGTPIDYARKNGKVKIVELLESFEKNPNETRIYLRSRLGLNDFGNQEMITISKDEKEKVEESFEEISKGPTYEIEYNNNVIELNTTAQTIPEIKNEIKSKFQIPENTKIQLYYKENGNEFVLDDIEDLVKGMRIKVSTSKLVLQIEQTQLKNWREIAFLNQASNSEFQVEIDPDEISSQIKTQVAQIMEELSKLETCIKSQSTSSNVIFLLNFATRNKAEKVYEQIVEILESDSSS